MEIDISESKGDPAKRRAILEAATRVFFKAGYRAASMDHVAGEADVSKQTVYAHFGSKESLFEAIIRAKVDTLVAPAVGLDGDGEPEAVLSAVAQRFIDMVLQPEGVSLLRVILSERSRFPELAETVYRSGTRLAADGLAKYLARMDTSGALSVADPRAAAQLFFSMLRGDIYMRTLLGVGPQPAEAEIAANIRLAVGTFLARFSP